MRERGLPVDLSIFQEEELQRGREESYGTLSFSGALAKTMRNAAYGPGCGVEKHQLRTGRGRPPPPSSRHLGQHPEAGASAVEFAIAAPALILALLGTFQAALLYQARLQLEKEFIDFLNKNPKEAEKYGKTPIISYSEVHGANPEAIANRAYGNRYGNGGVENGDGWRYRGRGMIQLTFKDNYNNITNSFQQLYKKDISFLTIQTLLPLQNTRCKRRWCFGNKEMLVAR